MRALYSLVLFGFLLSACATLPAQTISPAHTAMQDQYKQSYLHIIGPNLVNVSGQTVDLRGINIGGWLVTENWMCGLSDDKDTKDANGVAGSVGRATLEDLEERFGPEKASALINAWQDHWMTTRDLDQIQRDGFNLIRVPFSYRTLEHADGSWIVDEKGEIDFSRMDWIVRQAAQRGMYTIFDLHVWPDQRTAYDRIGRPEGAEIRQSMSRLWTSIAVHYRGNGAIAAFDLINELPGAWGVQQALSAAVKTGDPNRIQVIEGFTFTEFLKIRDSGQFANSVFSDHLYGTVPLKTEEIEARLKETLQRPVPVYIGEFLAENFRAAAAAMDQSQTAWSSWTYKTVDMGDWGVFNYPPTVETDIQHDSFTEILANWSTELTAWQAPGGNPDALVNPDRHLETSSPVIAPLS